VFSGVYERLYIGGKQAFLRFSLFKSWSAVAIYFCTVIQAIIPAVEIYFLCLYLMGVKGFSPLETGIRLLAYCGIAVPVSALIGWLIARVGSYRWAIWIGWTITTVSLGLQTLLDTDTSTTVWVLIFLLAGVGQATLFLVHAVACQAACDQKDVAYASAMYTFMQSLGYCLGVSLGGTIFQNFLRIRMIGLNLEDLSSIAQHAEGLAYMVGKMPDSSDRTLIAGAVAWAFKMLFATLCGISGLALVIAIVLIEGHSLNQDLESQHTLREIRDEKRISRISESASEP
jgi:hypothetical protein